MGDANSSSCNTTEISINPACCRICYENEKKEELITPCDCKGSIAYVHKSCLRKWLSESQTTECELCHVSFENISPPNASIRYSVVPTRFKNDIIMCTVVTPIAIIMTYVCFLSSENYSQYLSTDQWIWASVIFLLIGIILIGYWLWVYSVIRVHARLWRYSVRYLPSAASNPDCYSNNTETPNVVVEVGNSGEGHSHSHSNNANEQNARLCQMT